MTRLLNRSLFVLITTTVTLGLFFHATFAWAASPLPATVTLVPTPTALPSVPLTVTSATFFTGAEKPALSSGTLVTNPIVATTQVDDRAKPSGSNLAAAPVINLWYGPQQPFGQQGNPQRWANILGNVANPSSIASLVYSLNGGAPNALARGPDTRRLAQAGDFNIELDVTQLRAGANQVVITATDKSNVRTMQTVTANYTTGTSWPLPYTADWATAPSIQAVAQIVDGQWTKSGGTIRPTWLDYDRLIGIGDMSWKNYEVVVPMTIHAIDNPDGFYYPSSGPGVGVLMRWSGHYQEATEQPRVGWRELGSLGWFRWSKDPSGNILAGLQLLGYYGSELAVNPAVVPEFGKPYIFKMRVQSVANGGDIYRVKVWEAAQTEPTAWQMEGRGNPNEPSTGSLLLVAHHVDVSFGKVTVTPLADEPLGALFSDDFNACALNDGRWTFVNPRGDATLGLNGQQLAIAVPGGLSHDVWSGGNFAPRLMQAIPNTDFELITKFESPVTAQYQLQGIVVQQDANNYLRLDFFHDGTNTRIYAASFAGSANGGVPTQRATRIIAGGQPLFMRISRTGNQWVQAYSTDGSNWQTNVTFSHPMTVAQVGVFAGNSGGTPPAHTAVIDYFFNSAAPIAAEDGNKIGPTIQQNGDGTVSLSPNQPTYQCGQSVTLTATPAAGWHFTGWQGAATGTQAQTTVVAARNQLVTATFAPDAPPVTYGLTTTVQGSGTIERSPVKQAYAPGEVVTLTVIPAEGWEFVGWSGDLTGTANPKPITMNANQQVTAILSQRSYPLTVQTVGNGNVNRTPPGESYQHGTVVQLDAVAAVGWRFVGWSGDLTGTITPATVTMDRARNVTALLTPLTYPLTVQTVGNGQIIRTPPGETYEHGTAVQLNAVPAAGWQFVGWSGDLVDSAAEVDLLITSAQQITATFTEQVQGQFALSTINIGEGQIQLDPQLPVYPAGTTVTAHAIPADGWTFVRWEGDLLGSENPQQLVVQQNQLIGSVFAREMVDFVTEIQGDGTIASSLPVGSYAYGTPITVTALPAPNAVFLGWGGDLNSTQPQTTLLLDRDMKVIARFGLPSTALALQATGQGQVVASNQGPYTLGQKVQINAVAADGWSFANWAGDLSGTENPTTVVMDRARSIVAVFAEVPIANHKFYLPLITR